MNTIFPTILGFIAGVFVTVFIIYWFRACFNLLTALLNHTLASCGSDLIIFGGGVCLGGVLLAVLTPGPMSTPALFSLYAGIVGGLALAGLGCYLMTREAKQGCDASGDR